MVPKDFDINGFAETLTKQAQEVFPKDLPEDLKSFVISVLSDFVKIAGDSLKREEQFYNEEQTVLICQLIGEWMYYIGINNYRNEIPQEYWKLILQQVSFAIFKKTKEGVKYGYSECEIVDIVEKIVNEKYIAFLEQLIDENKIPIDKQANLIDFINVSKNEEKNKEITKKIMKIVKIILMVTILLAFVIVSSL